MYVMMFKANLPVLPAFKCNLFFLACSCIILLFDRSLMSKLHNFSVRYVIVSLAFTSYRVVGSEIMMTHDGKVDSIWTFNNNNSFKIASLVETCEIT